MHVPALSVKKMPSVNSKRPCYRGKSLGPPLLWELECKAHQRSVTSDSGVLVQTSWLQKGQQSADAAVNGITSLSNSLASKVPEMPSQLPTMPTTALYNAFGVPTSLLDPYPW